MDGDDVMLNNDLELENRINNYDHVESTVVRKDEKGNITDQWVEVIKIIRINKKKPFIGGFQNVSNNIEYWNAFAQTDQKKTNHKLCFTRETQTYEWISKSTKVKRHSDGRITEVHTPFTIRAKELMDLYKGLKMKNISTDERLDILLNTKWTVKEWDCNLTREIVDLIDREANMLDRGRPEKSLEGLRQRLANLFLQFIEYPLFNP
ncbi:unnamed protein product [Sphagnum balticum]